MLVENSISTAPHARELVVTRLLDAPRPLVFDVLTDPRHVLHWWGPEGFVANRAELDPRPGGSWRVCMRSPEGVQYCAHGVYREIVPPERLVFTWAWSEPDSSRAPETLVMIDLEDLGEQTLLTLRHGIFETVDARDSHRWGWTSCIERLSKFVRTM